MFYRDADTPLDSLDTLEKRADSLDAMQTSLAADTPDAS